SKGFEHKAGYKENLQFFFLLHPLSSSSAEEEFDLSNSMLEDERNHGDQVTDQEDTMEEVEHLQQDNNEVVYLSDLEDCFDEEEP
ncbi:hypothetical protein KI387_042372, partial [Taxus chinensis]